MGAANRKGVVNVMAELGDAGQVTLDILRQTERGLRHILHRLGMLPDYVPDTAHVLEPLKDIGDSVELGEVVGLVHHPDTPDA